MPTSISVSYLRAGQGLWCVLANEAAYAVTIGRRSRGGTYFEGIIDNVAAGTPVMKSNGKSRMKEDYYV